MTLSSEETSLLLAAATAAREHAYAPYSGFRVGAALLTSDGRMIGGCNVENSAYSVTCCAERSALFAAVSQGCREFRAIAVVADTAHTPPCGVCRQALAEFHPALPVILADGAGAVELTTLDALLPHPFTPDFLPPSR